MLERLGRIASRIAFVVLVLAYVYDPIRRARRYVGKYGWVHTGRHR